jgi:transposase
MNGAILHDHLLEKYPDLQVSASTVREYVAVLREELGIPRAVKVRQYAEVAELPPGFQSQVDMGQKNLKDFYGNKVKVYIFAMVMSHSRKKFMYFQDHPFNADEFVNAHDLAFRYFGGRTKEIVYDQDCVMTVSENAGDLMLTEVFEAYVRYAGFGVHLCRGNDPQSKGKIEAVIKYIKNHFLTCRDYPGISRLNSDGLEWLERTANEKKHETTHMIPNRVFLEEVKHLSAVPELSKPVLPKSAIVRPTNVVHYKRNRYEVPKGTYRPGKQVHIKINDKTIMFIDIETGELLSQHEISTGVGKLISLPRNHERFKKETPGRREELEIAVLEGFSDCDGSRLFVEEIINKYPRYVCDQLRIIRKSQEKYSKGELERALVYCIERELFSANDFRDTLEYFRKEQPIIASCEVKLDIKYSMVTAQIRDLSAYTSIGTGGEHYAT